MDYDTMMYLQLPVSVAHLGDPNRDPKRSEVR